MKTSDLITLLSQDAPVRISLNRALAHSAIAATIMAGGVFFGFIGFRVDIVAAIESVRFLFKFVITIALAISAGMVLFRIGKPGAPLGPWVRGLCLPVVLVAGAVSLELLVMPRATWEARMIGNNAGLYLTIIPLLSAFPLACFLYAMRHGAPERPGAPGLFLPALRQRSTRRTVTTTAHFSSGSGIRWRSPRSAPWVRCSGESC